MLVADGLFYRRCSFLEQLTYLLTQLRRVFMPVHCDSMLNRRLQQLLIGIGSNGYCAVGIAWEFATINEFAGYDEPPRMV